MSVYELLETNYEPDTWNKRRKHQRYKITNKCLFNLIPAYKIGIYYTLVVHMLYRIILLISAVLIKKKQLHNYWVLVSFVPTPPPPPPPNPPQKKKKKKF